MPRINVNNENSVVVNGLLYITKLKAVRVSKALQKFVNYKIQLNHPKFGEMVNYKGYYSRSPIHL